MNDLVIL